MKIKINAVKEDVKQPVEDIVNLEYTQNDKFILGDKEVAYFLIVRYLLKM